MSDEEDALYHFYGSEEIAPASNSYWQKRRELTSLLHGLQLAAHTQALSEDDLESLCNLLRAPLAEALAADTVGERSRWVDNGSYGNAGILHTEMTPIVGPSNGLCPGLSIWFDGQTVRASVSFNELYEGNLSMVHGGWIAAVFDEVLGTAQVLSGKSGFTGTLSTKYHRPTPLNTALQISARIDDVSGRKISVSAEMFSGELMLASAEAVFISKN